MYKATKILYFEAAHRIEGHKGGCQNLHGHSYKVEITLQAHRLDELGMVVDFSEIKRIANERIQRYDHSYLNEVGNFSKGINPTAENLAHSLYHFIKDSLMDYDKERGLKVNSIKVWETKDSYAEYSEG